jgi:uncharacterized protein (UPF0333 family)
MLLRQHSQVSTEYLFVVSFSIAMLIPIIALSFSLFSDYSSTISLKQTVASLQTIIQTAYALYNIGPASTQTIAIQIPDAIQSVDFYSSHVVARILTTRGVEDIILYSPVQLSGSLPLQKGTYHITLTSYDTYVGIS